MKALLLALLLTFVASQKVDELCYALCKHYGKTDRECFLKCFKY